MRNRPSSAKFQAMLDEFEDYKYQPGIQEFGKLVMSQGPVATDMAPEEAAVSNGAPASSGKLDAGTQTVVPSVDSGAGGIQAGL